MSRLGERYDCGLVIMQNRIKGNLLSHFTIVTRLFYYLYPLKKTYMNCPAKGFIPGAESPENLKDNYAST